jgi:hypothetical protein
LSLTAALLLTLAIPAAAAPQAPPQVVKAAEARIAAAEKRVQLGEMMAQRGAISSEQLGTILRMWFIAHREAPLSPGKLVQAATTYRDKVAERLKRAELRFNQGALMSIEVAAVQYDLTEAEFWLEEAKWKASGKDD